MLSADVLDRPVPRANSSYHHLLMQMHRLVSDQHNGTLLLNLETLTCVQARLAGPYAVGWFHNTKSGEAFAAKLLAFGI
jgi:hypothetical protein